MTTERVTKKFDGKDVVVAAPGPSLTNECVARWKEYPTFVVNDAWRMIPKAEVLYAADYTWWRVNKGAPDFLGERWSCNDKRYYKDQLAKNYGIKLISGKHGTRFSTDPELIFYGKNSGFQAVNLAILMGAKKVILIGFDMRVNQGKRHFFGDHKPPLYNTASYDIFIDAFDKASSQMPVGVSIVNATPGSALKCFPFVEELEDACT